MELTFGIFFLGLARADFKRLENQYQKPTAADCLTDLPGKDIYDSWGCFPSC